MAASTLTDADALAEAVAKSGLLPADATAKVRKAAAGKPDAKTLARDLVKDGTLTRWQAAQLLHGYSTLVIGKYRLLDQLGAGETGRVYLAEHAQMNRRHALKVLSRRQTSRSDVLKRFLAEAQRVCALEHRNLSHVYDVNQEGDKYYLVMEYVEGQDLKKLVEAGGPLSAAKATALLLQATDGLAQAHRQGVVHGDLKPTNLIVDSSGTLKVTDIGQARLIVAAPSGPAEETTEAAALAAAMYRAPELVAGKQDADVKSDVYSLGNIACFLLAGKAAKDAADAQRFLSDVKGAPAELTDLCVSMLSADASKRPADMPAVQSTLLAIAKGLSDSQSPKAAAPPMPKAKKPPVAKALDASDDHTKVIAAAPAREQESDSGNPLAGLSIQPPRSRAAKPAVKAAAAKSDPVTPRPGTVTAPGTVNLAAPAPRKKSLAPVIIVAALGGVLLVGCITAAVVVGLNWSRAPAQPVAVATKAIDSAAKAAADAAAQEKAIQDALAAASIGETNPAAPAETNPAPPTAAPAKPAEPAPAPEPAKPAAETKPEIQTEPAKTDSTKTAPNPTEPSKTEAANSEPAKPEPAKPDPAKTEPPNKTEPPPLREPPKAEPAKPEPAKPAPAKPAAASNTFQGLPTAIDLPKLTPGMTDPSADALVSLVIGPCTPDTTAQLKGGQSALRGGKTTFELREGKDDQSLGKWDVVMTIAQAPLNIAQLSVQNKQLAFQWTAEGAKNESSPYLGNCKLVLSAGTDQHEISLRKPIEGEPLLVDLEKPGATVKWTVEHLPDPRKIVVEISRLGEAFPAHKFDPSPTMEGNSADTLVWIGADPENALLGIKFESSQTPKFVQVKGAAQLKSGGKAEPLIKRKLLEFVKGIDSRRFALLKKQEAFEKAEAKTDTQKKIRQVELDNTKKELEGLAATEEQTKQVQQLIEELKEKSEVHFRVYYLADESSQVDLVVTDTTGPKEKKPAAKPDAGKAKK